MTSARNRDWVIKRSTIDNNLNMPEHLLQVAAARGVTDAKKYFKPSFTDLMPDPLSLVGMPNAVNTLLAKMDDDERIVVVGDYDVDGATSVAQMVRFFKAIGYEKFDYRIPLRMSEGYGLNPDIVQEIIDSGAGLIISVDSGTTALPAVKKANEHNIPVIIIDHHEAAGEDDEHLPDAILVNPKQPKEDRSYEYLCTAGLIFIYIIALNRALKDRNRPYVKDMNPFMALAALGTVCDVVPLVDLNRAIVKHGLERLTHLEAIRSLSRHAMNDHVGYKFTAADCGFVFGPCLNAAGRLDDMALGVQLLTLEDEGKINKIAKTLNQFNRNRKEMQKKAVKEAVDMVKKSDIKNTKVIISYNEEWHPGIVGLIASKLKDFFDCPAIAIGTGGKGSCRSVEGFDIGQAIITAVSKGLLIKGGGHAMAAGLTLDPDKMGEFSSYMNQATKDLEPEPLYADLEIDVSKLTVPFIRSFDAMEPFGQHNPRPRVIIRNCYVSRVQVIKDLHIKAYVRNAYGGIEVVLWNGIDSKVGKMLLNADDEMVDIYGTLEVNDWNGNSTPTISPEDITIKARQ